MGELLSYSLYGSWTLGGEQPSSPNTIALDFAFWESDKPWGGWDERSSSRSMRRSRKCLAGVQEGERAFTLPSIAHEEGCSGATAAKWRAMRAGELMG